MHLPQIRAKLLHAALALWNAYQPYVNWESSQALEQRVCVLLPALMLSRIDGKSPVEYLSEPNRQQVRELALRQLRAPSLVFSDVLAAIETQLGNERQ